MGLHRDLHRVFASHCVHGGDGIYGRKLLSFAMMSSQLTICC